MQAIKPFLSNFGLTLHRKHHVKLGKDDSLAILSDKGVTYGSVFKAK